MTDLPTEYGPLVYEIFSAARSSRQPCSGTFELTARCNLSCRMCYIQHRAGDTTCRKKEIPAAAWVELARQAVDQGMLFLLLTGGEVFVRPDFFEIYEPLTQMGLVITLFTNGTLISPEIGERLAQAPPSRTEITLYGATAETFESVTGVKGSYAACCKGIETLLCLRVPLAVKTTVTRQNIGELAAMGQMAKNWGTPFFNSTLLTRRYDGVRSDVDNCRLSAEDCVSLEAADEALVAQWTQGASTNPPKDKSVFTCNAGKASFAINSVGEMNICSDLPLPAALPFENGFTSSWEEVVRYVDSTPDLSHACQVCEDKGFCDLCPGWSFRETGTLNEPSNYLCDIARARKERFLKRV